VAKRQKILLWLILKAWYGRAPCWPIARQIHVLFRSLDTHEFFPLKPTNFLHGDLSICRCYACRLWQALVVLILGRGRWQKKILFGELAGSVPSKWPRRPMVLKFKNWKRLSRL
jgi:hypothetical protein